MPLLRSLYSGIVCTFNQLVAHTTEFSPYKLVDDVWFGLVILVESLKLYGKLCGQPVKVIHLITHSQCRSNETLDKIIQNTFILAQGAMGEGGV